MALVKRNAPGEMRHGNIIESHSIFTGTPMFLFNSVIYFMISPRCSRVGGCVSQAVRRLFLKV